MKAILVAEDDPAVRNLMEDVLAAVPGWRVTVVADGAQAMDAVNAVSPDLVVLDQNMPKLSGLEVYARLRQRDDTAAIPVLFVSAVRRLRAGVPPDASWLSKPFDVDALLDTVADLLGEEMP